MNGADERRKLCVFAVAYPCGREGMAYVQGESLKVMSPSTGGFELPAAAPFAAKRLQKRVVETDR